MGGRHTYFPIIGEELKSAYYRPVGPDNWKIDIRKKRDKEKAGQTG
jgi:hypothetical protein